MSAALKLNDDTRRFLDKWFAARGADTELCEVRPLNKRPGMRPQPQRWGKTADDVIAYAAKCDALRDDVYIGALPRKQASGKADAVGTLAWIFADIDYGTVGHVKPAAHSSRDDALQAIDAIGIPPTMIVDSGGGFHVWWQLAEEPTFEHWHDAIRRTAAATGGDMQATDRPRILRLPGTHNHKVEPPRDVKLVEFRDLRTDISVFHSLPDVPVPQGRGHTDGSQTTPKRQRSTDKPFDRANDVPIADVMNWLGVKMHRQGNRVYCACPVHRGTNTDQMVVGGDENTAHCFGDCDQSFSPVDVVAGSYGIDPKAAVNRIAERFGFDGFPAGYVEPRPVASKRSNVVSLQTREPVEVDGAASAFQQADPTDWKHGLDCKADQSIKSHFGNVMKIVRRHPELGERLTYDEMRLQPLLDGALVTDKTFATIRERLQDDAGFTPKVEDLRMAIGAIAEERSFHPVRRYLQSLQWDGELRLDNVASSVLGADKSAASLVKRWFISAVARAMRPGCKVDTALVLVGPQGWRKSTFFSILGGEWFADTYMDITDPDGKLQLHSAWIYEWAEIESVTSKKQAADVKQFVTSQIDTFRAPYGRAVQQHRRSTVIVGTTNETQFLSDPTGSRRFWVVKIEKKIDADALRAVRDQLWAEAVAAYGNGSGDGHAGACWWLDEAEDAERELVADEYRIEDPWEESIADWLESADAKAKPLTTVRVLTGALQLDPHQRTQVAMNRAGAVMRALGYRVHVLKVAKRSTRVWRKVDGT